jgi:hypothetical protein
MKRIIIIWFALVINQILIAQDLFDIGLKYYEKGQYALADSVFKICMEKSKPDVNLWFNYASTRLYLRDTSTFCTMMWNLSNQYNDREAKELFLKLCGSVDTTFYDKDFVKCDKKNARYTEIMRMQNGLNYKMCFLHDKRKKANSIIMSADYMNLQKTDIIAQYQLLKDGSKIYLFTSTPPTYKEGEESRSNYIEKNSYAKEAKEKLHISKLVVDVKYIIDRNNVVRDIEITNTNKPVSDMALLKKYVELIILSIPRQAPGKYQNENVDFLVNESISIW